MAWLTPSTSVKGLRSEEVFFVDHASRRLECRVYRYFSRQSANLQHSTVPGQSASQSNDFTFPQPVNIDQDRPRHKLIFRPNPAQKHSVHRSVSFYAKFNIESLLQHHSWGQFGFKIIYTSVKSCRRRVLVVIICFFFYHIIILFLQLPEIDSPRQY